MTVNSRSEDYAIFVQTGAGELEQLTNWLTRERIILSSVSGFMSGL